MANIDLGEALISLIGGFTPGYARGRTYKAEKKVEAEEREHKRATEERVFEQRQNKINEQIAGREEMFGLLEAAGGISPRTPADEVLKIKAQYLDAADRAGHDLKTAQALFDDAVMSRKPQQPSPLDVAKVETEKAKGDLYKARKSFYFRKAKSLRENELVSSINALRQLQENLVDDLGDVTEGNEETYNELQAQIDAYLEENARRKGVKKIKKPEVKEVKERIKVDY